MSTHRIAWLTCGLLVLAGLGLAYWARTATTDATVIVEWSTASELDTAGFNLYRSDSPTGPFACINDHLIPASPDPLIGGSYVFTDTGVVAGHTYYYQLEDVETSGMTTQHGPIEVKAKAGARTEMLITTGLATAALLGSGMLLLRGRWHARDWPHS